MNAQCCCFHTSTLPAWHRLYSRPTSTCRLRHVHSRLSTNTPQSHQGRQHHTDKQAEQHQHQQFDSLVKQLLPLSYTELQQLQADATDSGNPALSASFLFWLSAQEKAALGTRKQVGRGSGSRARRTHRGAWLISRLNSTPFPELVCVCACVCVWRPCPGVCAFMCVQELANLAAQLVYIKEQAGRGHHTFRSGSWLA